MSEKLQHTPSPERHNHVEHASTHEKENLKHLQEKAKNTAERSPNELESIKKSIENSAVSGKEYSVGERENQAPSQTFATTKGIKKTTYKKTLKKTQKKLSPPERTLSKVIHNPAVEKTSEIASKTVARPSGILAGGIGAFIGTLIVFYISKRVGFTYNYTLFIIIFVACYFFGILMEFLLQLFTRKSR